MSNKNEIKEKTADSVRLTESPWNSQRSISRRYGRVTIDELQKWIEDNYVVAKCDVETEEPTYPCRPSKKQKYKTKLYHSSSPLEMFRGLGPIKSRDLLRQFGGLKEVACADVDDLMRVKGISRLLAQSIHGYFHQASVLVVGEDVYHWQTREIPNYDKSTWTYPTGDFTTWLRTAEIRKALKYGHIKEAYEALVTMQGDSTHQRKWRKVREQVLSHYGRKCMRCGRSEGELHIDHIQQWAWNPKLRYDTDNLQVLCIECHEWKTKEERLNPPSTSAVDKLDFRPSEGRKNFGICG